MTEQGSCRDCWHQNFDNYSDPDKARYVWNQFPDLQQTQAGITAYVLAKNSVDLRDRLEKARQEEIAWQARFIGRDI